MTGCKCLRVKWPECKFPGNKNYRVDNQTKTRQAFRVPCTVSLVGASLKVKRLQWFAGYCYCLPTSLKGFQNTTMGEAFWIKTVDWKPLTLLRKECFSRNVWKCSKVSHKTALKELLLQVIYSVKNNCSNIKGTLNFCRNYQNITYWVGFTTK